MNNRRDDDRTSFTQRDDGQAGVYELRIAGHLDARWSAWFDGMSLMTEDGTTTIRGAVADQPALHGLLQKVRDLGLELVSVNRLQTEQHD
jgi:hypothetical protein